MYNVIVVTTFNSVDIHSVDVEDDLNVEVFTFDAKDKADAFAKEVNDNFDNLPGRELVYTNVVEVINDMTLVKYKEELQSELVEE